MSAYSPLFPLRRTNHHHVPIPDHRPYFASPPFAWPADLDSSPFPSYSPDASSWHTAPLPLPNFPLRPASDDGHTFIPTIHTSRSLSSSPGSGSSAPISTPKDWPITPNTSTALDDLFPPSHSQHTSPRTSHSYSHSRTQSPAPSPFTPHAHPHAPSVVKVEPPEDQSDSRFIIENPTPSATYLTDKDTDDPSVVDTKVASFVSSQALAPPTEVPLRATQAPKKMKGMMGVFRINPFAMHSGSEGKGAAPTVCWEPGPLEEEPVMFEFQLDMVGFGEGEDGEEGGLEFEDNGASGGAGGLDETTVEGRLEEGGENREDQVLRMSELHAFAPDFDLQDGFGSAAQVVSATATGVGLDRYRRDSPTLHHQHRVSLSEDQQPQAAATSCDNTNSTALLPPQEDQRGSPVFALEYPHHHHHHHHQHHHHHLQHQHHNQHHIPKPHCASPAYTSVRSGVWNHHHQRPEAGNGTLSSSETVSSQCRTSQTHGRNQVTTQGLEDQEDCHYRATVQVATHYGQNQTQVQQEQGEQVVGDVETQCSYPILTQTMHQQNGFIPVDPEAVAYHHHQRQGGHGTTGVPSSLGLYGISGGGEYQSQSAGVEEDVEGGGVMSDVRVSESASGVAAAAAAAVSAGMEVNQDASLCGGVLRHQSSRGARASSQHHRMYKHHPYLRPVHAGHGTVTAPHYHHPRDHGGYEGYDEQQGVYVSTCGQEFPSPSQQSSRHATGRFWSRSFGAATVLSEATRAS